MRQKMKRMIGFLLSLALMVGLLPGMSLTAYAATAYSSYVGTTTKVKFNDFEWYIIADNSTDSTPTVTLLAADEHFKKSENRRIDIYDKQKIDFTITNLEPGKMYYIRVRAYKKVKVGKKMKEFCSEWSETVKKRLR